MNSVEGPEPLADQPVLPAVRHHELLLRVLHGTFWMLNSNVFGRALNLARGVILARLLVPDDFGLFGLANMMLGFTAMFSDAGLLDSYGIVGISACPVSPNESV